MRSALVRLQLHAGRDGKLSRLARLPVLRQWLTRRQLVLPGYPLGQLVFDLAQQLAVVACPAVIGHQECVERVAVSSRVHARIQNAQVAAVEIAADPGEQAFLILDVDQHFGAFTDARQARPHDRPLALDLAEQRPRVPCDVLRAMPQKVDDIQLLPQRIARAV